MFTNYIKPEQLWYYRDLQHRATSDKYTFAFRSEPKPSEQEYQLLKELDSLNSQVKARITMMQSLIDEVFTPETQQLFREEMHPFVRPGELYFGSGHYSEYGCEKLHEELDVALELACSIQQGGLMGTEPDSEEVINNIREQLKGFLINLAQKLDVNGITFSDNKS